ncbi:MAG: hypothetical protein HZA13_07605 [Nitrospirae bacterium]|nr:hypothetical protein [Nitrospirota bacterium]
MSGTSKWEYFKAIYTRYQKASKAIRQQILNEFCQVCGYHRKYAIRRLCSPLPERPKEGVKGETKGRTPTYTQFGRDVDLLLIGDLSKIGINTTILDLVSIPPKILREGPIRISLQEVMQ